jgi:hypothetical protein
VAARNVGIANRVVELDLACLDTAYHAGHFLRLCFFHVKQDLTKMGLFAIFMRR